MKLTNLTVLCGLMVFTGTNGCVEHNSDAPSVGDGQVAAAAEAIEGDQGGGPPQEHKLVPEPYDIDAQLGFATDIDGDTAIVGAYRDDAAGEDAGAAHVFVRSGDQWVQQDKLVPDDLGESNYFGVSVAIDGDTAIVGANCGGAEDGGTGNCDDSPGAAYVFVRQGTSWTLQQKLKAMDDDPGDRFGRDVTIDGDTAVIGAHGDDLGGTNAGAVYVFKRTCGVWTEQLKIPGLGYKHQFGRAVKLENDKLIVGAPGRSYSSGAAYVHYRHADGPDQWGLVKEITYWKSNTGFGYDVDMSGDTVIVGFGWRWGARVYVRDLGGADNWGHQQDFVYEDVIDNRDVAIDGDVAVVGAPHADSQRGQARVWHRVQGTWTEQQVLAPSDPQAYSHFGISVAVSGSNILVGRTNIAEEGHVNKHDGAYIYPAR